jgi:Rha family phage regulatory protein
MKFVREWRQFHHGHQDWRYEPMDMSVRFTGRISNGRSNYVLADIRNLDCSDEFRKLNFQRTFQTVDMPNNARRKDPMFLMTKDGFIFLVMGYRGKKAAVIKEAYIRRFNDMEQFIKDYTKTREDFAPFTQAIMDAHDDAQSYHYSNEMNMINRIVLGMDAKHFRQLHGLQDGQSIRPFLSKTQSKAVRKLQIEDIRLLYRNVPFQERKDA